jgi:RNA polymerase sigma-70 factor (ECF subfamily)
MESQEGGITSARPMVSDEARASGLAMRAAEGDISALAVCYDLYARSLFRLALAILRSEADAEDVVAEVLIGLVGRKGRPIRDLQAFLTTSVRRRAISVLRERKREHPMENLPPGGTGFKPVLLCNAEADPEQAALARDLERAMAELSVEQREVLVLKVYEDMTFAEIARIVGVPMNTASSRYRLAIGKLRKILLKRAD